MCGGKFLGERKRNGESFPLSHVQSFGGAEGRTVVNYTVVIEKRDKFSLPLYAFLVAVSFDENSTVTIISE